MAYRSSAVEYAISKFLSSVFADFGKDPCMPCMAGSDTYPCGVGHSCREYTGSGKSMAYRSNAVEYAISKFSLSVFADFEKDPCMPCMAGSVNDR